MFILQNTPPPLSQAGDVTFRHFDIDGGSSKMDFTLNLEETADGAEGWFEYATDLFKPETMRRMVTSYTRLLEEFCARPEQRVAIIKPPTEPRILPPFQQSSGNGSRQPGPPASVAEPISLPAIQKQLAAIWSTVLSTPVVQPDDNLFDLGGHSLLVTQITSRIRKTWGVDIPIHHFFEHPTVAVISQLIEARLHKKAAR
jgi:aryl carrier-like protein